MAQPAEDERRSIWQRIRPWAKPLIIVTLSIVVGWIIVGFVGAIDWSQVLSAFGQLSWWQAIPLIAALLVRQTFNAVPLSRFVPGLSIGRSMQNDLTANLIGTVAPPPGDVVIRIAMFKSWSIDPVNGMAGVTLNTLTFYSVRFLAPAIGLLFLAFEEVDSGQVVAAAISTLIAVAVLTALFLVLRGESLAALLGRTAGRVVRRLRSSVDPDAWAMAVVDFRARMAETLKAGLAMSLGALVLMVLSDALILLLALRFVGVGMDTLPVTIVFGAFLVAYPLTLMPLAGLGVLDAALIAAWVEVAGLDWEPEIVAALVVWRSVTILGTLLLGTGVLAWWRRTSGSDVDDEGTRAML